MRAVVGLEHLEWAPKVTFAVALVAGTATCVGLVIQGMRALLRWRSAT